MQSRLYKLRPYTKFQLSIFMRLHASLDQRFPPPSLEPSGRESLGEGGEKSFDQKKICVFEPI